MEPRKEKPPGLCKHGGAHKALCRWDPVHVIPDFTKRWSYINIKKIYIIFLKNNIYRVSNPLRSFGICFLWFYRKASVGPAFHARKIIKKK